MSQSPPRSVGARFAAWNARRSAPFNSEVVTKGYLAVMSKLHLLQLGNILAGATVKQKADQLYGIATPTHAQMGNRSRLR